MGDDPVLGRDVGQARQQNRSGRNPRRDRPRTLGMKLALNLLKHLRLD